jgi:hypothetical protein
VELPRLQQRKILYEFVEGLKKKDGSNPAGSVMNFLTSIGCALCRAQEQRIVTLGQFEPPFCWREDAMMRQVAWAAVLCMWRSQEAGVGIKRKQVKVMPRLTQVQILSSLCMCLGHPRGLMWRSIYYCLFHFGLRGGCELY